MATREIHIETLRVLFKEIGRVHVAMENDAMARAREVVRKMYEDAWAYYRATNFFKRIFISAPNHVYTFWTAPKNFDDWSWSDVTRYWSAMKDRAFTFKRALENHPYSALAGHADRLNAMQDIVFAEAGNMMLTLNEAEYTAIEDARTSINEWASMQSNNS
jgi:hypothetical protein